ncbi:MAG: hypothetical protein ABJN04_01740 [Hyphomicrobiales bacterium]
MLPRFITKEIHAYLDYPVAITLIVMPFALGLGETNPMAFWLSFATGIAAFLLTVLTDHHLGVFKVLPYKFHLTVDGIVGATFVVAPFLFGFAGLEFWYYVVFGLTVLLVVGMHKSNPQMDAM